MFFERFFQAACFSAARFTFRQPKTPVRNATNLRTFFLKTMILPFKRLFACPVTLDHQISVFYSSLYFYTSNTFRPILARFSHILVYANFFLMCFSTQNMFLIPDDAVARNLTIIFNFSSQRPHLNYIFLQFDTMEFSMKNNC